MARDILIGHPAAILRKNVTRKSKNPTWAECLLYRALCKKNARFKEMSFPSRSAMTPSVLLIAYHFPPLAGSSGIQRTLRFAQHLPGFGWTPLVLSADPRAYERLSADLLDEIPAGMTVERAFALDTARHLSLCGRYPGFLARPDRWMTWRWDAVRLGMRMIRRYRPQVIWSTYPIATAHEIGHALHRRSGLPWVADFRDPMAQENYPPDPRVHRHFQSIEKKVFATAAAAVFTTRGCAQLYSDRFPQSGTRLEIIENGYDEESFAGLGESSGPLVPGKLTFLHSGIIYPSERDPRAFLDALAQLQQRGEIDSDHVLVRLRAAVHDQFLHEEIQARHLEKLVELAPPIPYRQALQEMSRADALVVMQAANCNEQIPAKIYEYLRARRPILGLTDAGGDTADVLRRAGLDDIAPLDNPGLIGEALVKMLRDLRAGRIPLPCEQAIQGASRAGRTRALADLFVNVTGRV
jgi:glycosyltransferase involved in cell wall biosynthesis